MSVRTLLTQTVTVLRQTPGGSDAEGNPIDTEVATSSSYPCRLQPLTAAELPAGAPLQEGLHRLYLLPGTPIDGTDRVQVSGRAYDVVGPPMEEVGRDGTTNHMLATVRRVEV